MTSSASVCYSKTGQVQIATSCDAAEAGGRTGAPPALWAWTFPRGLESGCNPLLFRSTHSVCFWVVTKPQNIHNDVDLIQRFSRCRTLESTTALEIGIVIWAQKDKPALRWVPFRAWPQPPTPEELAQAWREALDNSRFFCVCNLCRMRQNRGEMHDEFLCHGCAERDFGPQA